MIEVASTWKSTNVTRLTIMTDGGEGKVQVDFFVDNDEYGHTAYIWDLWVKPEHRRNGIASQLMEYALQRARDYGYKTATLEWVLDDTPREIAHWYARLGFDEQEFSNTYALMVNQL